ncbi:tRNA pseudouridine(38-40) synthase TruA [Pseudochelatococcus lubricantis]|uniref:tRNA pseudouridine(38-40) synthase TruA n=1 Tax=Pseudochelatococcus lubricantis TaxID=1538102 RepID=UPI0035EEDE15
MPRYRLIVEYDGTPYVGWQWQDNGRAVQQAVEEAIAACTNERMRVQCAGRTDAGVHATHQVVHVDLVRDWRADRLRDAVNAHLKLQGDTVAVVAADAVDEAFDARHSAIRRHYLYRILNRRPQPALERNRVWHVPRQLDAPAMHEAAQRLVGKHDFTTFRAADCQAASPLRTLERLDVERTGDEIRIFAAARSFLHHQVRSMAGTLELVGAGKWTPDDVTDALEARQRARCGTMAPACGLYLIGVDYP